ncbi:hypothetical protein, partial [Salmonella sp. SAL4355]|uniref:hypothetical protein n=1 Tax=Salmonella sp. SAL4355 TaxID=3159876 RepID=UPI00397C7B99
CSDPSALCDRLGAVRAEGDNTGGSRHYDKIFLNMAVLVLVFFGLGFALIGIDRRMGATARTPRLDARA